jgi:hypothetical protein
MERSCCLESYLGVIEVGGVGSGYNGHAHAGQFFQQTAVEKLRRGSHKRSA